MLPTFDFVVHGTLDGAVLRYGGHVVDEFQTTDAAAEGWATAREALVMLDRVLSSERA